MRRGRRHTAARLLRVLATVENLVVNDQLSEARRVLLSVDPLEAKALADELERSGGEGRGTGRLRLLPSPTRNEAGHSVRV